MRDAETDNYPPEKQLMRDVETDDYPSENQLIRCKDKQMCIFNDRIGNYASLIIRRAIARLYRK
ncbi:MAG: hypothetical protein RL065_923 [Bacteroidota bacterium]